MQKSPTNDKSLGIVVNHENSFAELRQRAMNEYIDRKKSIKKKKKEPDEEILLCPDSKVVLINESFKDTRSYLLVEIVDFFEETDSFWYGKEIHFHYFGLVLAVSDEKMKKRIGHLTEFDTRERNSWISGLRYSKLKEKDVKPWIRE